MKVRAARARPSGPAESGETALCHFDREIDAVAAKVLPGEYLVSGDDIALVTLLGSCVAACLRDPVAGIGGINHFMLPEGGAGVASESARYGGYAMEMLMNELIKRGARRERIEAKVFGGGNVVKGFTTGTVGERNARFVKEYLAREGVPIVAEDLLGNAPRKIYFYPRTGRVLVKRLPGAGDAEIQMLERLYERKLHDQPVVEGGVELFQ